MQTAATHKTDRVRHSVTWYSYPKRMTARIVHFHLIKSAVNVNPSSPQMSSKNFTNSTSLLIYLLEHIQLLARITNY